MPIKRIGDAEPEAERAADDRDHWSRLLNGYNAANKWRNGGNGHGR
jgi:hypothetical protein